MGGVAINDIAGAAFWLFAALAIVVVSLGASLKRSTIILTAFNLGFCALLVGALEACVLSLAIVCFYASSRSKVGLPRAIGLGLSVSILFSIFLVHKLSFEMQPMQGLKSILAAIGFSYIFLRAMEYMRAAQDDLTGDLSFADTVNYLIPFHMLAAGPIMSFAEFRQYKMPAETLSREEAMQAIERIASGLFKKFVLANGIIQPLFLTDFKADGWYFWIELQFYYLFIYLEFSAYSDIAVGLGRLLGYRTPENFNHPLSSRNIVVFWERWHISLSQFIRRNIFIPIQLAGLRYTKGQSTMLITSVAFTSAFVLCGLWHGVSWRFALWGLGHALALIICTMYREWLTQKLGRKQAKDFSERPWVRAISTLLTFEFVASSLAFLVVPELNFLD
jgi:alginate O-acetyltransferase complex protein AlgI